MFFPDLCGHTLTSVVPCAAPPSHQITTEETPAQRFGVTEHDPRSRHLTPLRMP